MASVRGSYKCKNDFVVKVKRDRLGWRATIGTEGRKMGGFSRYYSTGIKLAFELKRMECHKVRK